MQSISRGHPGLRRAPHERLFYCSAGSSCTRTNLTKGASLRFRSVPLFTSAFSAISRSPSCG